MIRLKVRLGRALTCDSISLRCEGRIVELQSQGTDKRSKHSGWVVFIAKGFASEEVAKSFGERLRSQIELAALSVRVGVDTGRDRRTSWVNPEALKGSGLLPVQDVHGLLVLPDDPKSVILSAGSPDLHVTINPDQLTGAIVKLSDAGLTDLGDCTAGVRLLNQALMSSEWLSKSVLSFAAVEALGQDQKWSERQKERLDEIACQVENEATGENGELREIAKALRKLHRISLREGVKRVLEGLSLSDLGKEWDRLYAVRSDIFHGTTNLFQPEADKFATEALGLCTKIVIADVQKRVHQIPK